MEKLISSDHHEGAILNERLLASNQESRKQAVCLITVVGVDGDAKSKECGTGSLVEWPSNSKQLCVLTNRHVLPTAAIADKAQVVFRWQSAEGEFLNKKNYPREVRLDSSQLFLANTELDVALIAIDDSYRTVLSQVKPVLLESREPRNGDPVCFIGHPAGMPEQQRSVGGCLHGQLDSALAVMFVLISIAGQVTAVGFRVGDNDNFVLYSADSMGGSSGSPVFGAAFDKMVALHHHGTDAELHPNHNRGVLACRIRAWLEQQPCKAPRSSHELAAQVEDEPDMKDPRVKALAKIRDEHAAQVPKETRRQLAVCVAGARLFEYE